MRRQLWAEPTGSESAHYDLRPHSVWFSFVCVSIALHAFAQVVHQYQMVRNLIVSKAIGFHTTTQTVKNHRNQHQQYQEHRHCRHFCSGQLTLFGIDTLFNVTSTDFVRTWPLRVTTHRLVPGMIAATGRSWWPRHSPLQKEMKRSCVNSMIYASLPSERAN